MAFYLTIWSAVAATVGLVMAFARTGPDEARSKLAEWAEFFRLNRLAEFFNKYALDSRVLRYGKWMMLGLLFIGGMIFQGWLNAWPTNPAPPSAMQNDATKLPAPRSKQAINELLDESGSLLGVIEKSGPTLVNEWRESITTQNPARICLDIDSRTLQEKIATLANKLSSAHAEISAIYDKNRIDQPEFNKVFGYPMGGIGPAGFEAASQSLRQYAHEINLLGEHPACDAIIRTGNVNNIFVNMIRELDRFGAWTGQSQENLRRYRDELRKELRG